MDVAGRPKLALLLPALVALAVSACGSDDQPPSAIKGVPAGRPPHAPALRRLEAQANRLLDGGSEAFQRRLAELRGHPVVVNQWASWCPPCRREFPLFQRLATEYRGRVAFIGVNSQDNRDDARAFMKQFFTPYPHYFDPDTKVARLFDGGRAWPTTAYYDRRGKLTQTHLGGYPTKQKLEGDIRRYALRR